MGQDQCKGPEVQSNEPKGYKVADARGLLNIEDMDDSHFAKACTKLHKLFMCKMGKTTWFEILQSSDQNPAPLTSEYIRTVNFNLPLVQTHPKR